MNEQCSYCGGWRYGPHFANCPATRIFRWLLHLAYQVGDKSWGNLICLIRDAKQELEKLADSPALFIYMTPAVHDRLRDETFAFKEKEGDVSEFRLKTFMGMKVKIDATVPDALGIYLSHVELKLGDMNKRKTDVVLG